MIAVTTASRIADDQIVAYKGTAQGENFDELLKSAEALGGNAILNACYDDALDVDTLLHLAAVVIARMPVPQHLASGVPLSVVDQQTERTENSR